MSYWCLGLLAFILLGVMEEINNKVLKVNGANDTALG